MLQGFMALVLALLVGFIAAETVALRRWDRAWKLVALIPAAIVLFVVLRIVVDTCRDPTSHNLWPFEIVIWAGLGLVFLGLMLLARAVGRSRSSKS
jgi:protein-S-isoprenylcysteine O-methyltransferase Ste14